jgi:hypothetical protein
MPAEKFWRLFDREPGGDPDLTVEWGKCDAPSHRWDNCHGMAIHGALVVRPDDLSGLDRLIATLRRARRAMEPHRAPCVDGSVCGGPHCPPPDTPAPTA